MSELRASPVDTGQTQVKLQPKLPQCLGITILKPQPQRDFAASGMGRKRDTQQYFPTNQ